MSNEDYTKNSSATEVTTGSGAIYSFAYIDGLLKVKRTGKTNSKDMEWTKLYIYPSIETGKPLTLLLMTGEDEDVTILWTTPVQSILTGREVS